MDTCACGHPLQQHMRCGRDCAHEGCHECRWDIRAFKVDQGSVHYQDSGAIVSLGEHLARRGLVP